MVGRVTNNCYELNGYRYMISELIFAAKDEKLKPFELKVADIFACYEAPNENTLMSFIEHFKRVNEADLSFPIILSPDNVILDGRHRLAKAIIEEKKYIKAMRFDKMPDIGEKIE